MKRELGPVPIKNLRRVEGGPDPRRQLVCDLAGLDVIDQSLTADFRTETDADYHTENCIGIFPQPLGVAQHFLINGTDRLIPLATNERTVVAGASHAAKLCRGSGGFRVRSQPATATGQVLFGNFGSLGQAQQFLQTIHARLAGWTRELNREIEPVDRYGRRITDAKVRFLPCRHNSADPFVVVELSFDPGESMGGRMATEYSGLLADKISSLADRKPTAVICSNDSGYRVQAQAIWSPDLDTIKRILNLQEWARRDPSRRITHLKGLLNGIEAIGLATGQDTRALAAAALLLHRDTNGNDRWGPTEFRSQSPAQLEGHIWLTVPAATVGGCTSHPAAIAGRNILGVTTAKQLAEVVACVGLAQNFAALRCLAEEGIAAAFARTRPAE